MGTGVSPQPPTAVLSQGGWAQGCPPGLTPSLGAGGSCGWTWSCGMSPSTSAPAGRAGSRTRIAVTSTAPRYRPPAPRTPARSGYPSPRHPRPPAGLPVPRVPPCGLSFILSPGPSICLGSAALAPRPERFIVQIFPRHHRQQRRVTPLLPARAPRGHFHPAGGIAAAPPAALPERFGAWHNQNRRAG